MSRYNKARDVANQIGKIIEAEEKAYASYPGGKLQMYHDEIRANRQGKLFFRPKAKY